MPNQESRDSVNFYGDSLDYALLDTSELKKYIFNHPFSSKYSWIWLDARINLRGQGYDIPDKIETDEDLEKCRHLWRINAIDGKTFDIIVSKYNQMRVDKHREWIDEIKAKGGKTVKLSWFYPDWFREWPRNEASYIKDSRVWIKNTDCVVADDGVKFHKDDIHYSYRFCTDIQKFSSVFKLIYFEDWRKFIHDWQNISTILYRGDLYDSRYALEWMNLARCRDCRAYRPRGTPCSCNACGLERYHSWHWSDHFSIIAEIATMRVWLEIEKSRVMSGKVHKRMKKNHWRCETDSSVAAEYITPVLSLDDIEETVNFITETAPEVLNGPVTKSCGWHIHVSIENESPDDTYNRIVGYRPLLWALYPHRIGGYSNKDLWRHDHSVDVGVRRNTVEIRIFPWLNWERKLRFRLWLVKYMLENPKNNHSDALDSLIVCPKFKELLEIAYWDNTRRLKLFFERLVKFYELGTSEITKKVTELSDSMIIDKESWLTQEELKAMAKKKDII